MKYRKRHNSKYDPYYKVAGAIANDLKRGGFTRDQLSEECKEVASMFELDASLLEDKVNRAYRSMFVG